MISTNYTNKNSSKKKIYGIAGALITLAIPFFLMEHNADNHLETAQSLCPFKMLTGFPCPGCGITKSLVYLYQGEFEKSLYYHVLGPFVVLFCVAAVLLLSVELKTGKEYFNKWLYNKKLAYFLGAFLFCYHTIRLFYFIRTNDLDSIFRQSIWK